MNKQLNNEQTDAFREVATIGAGNAATALSQLINKKIDINVPNVNMVSVANVPDIFGSPEELVSSVYLALLGDISGVMLLTYSKEESLRLADLLLGKEKGKTKILNDMAQSALKECATILSGSYLNAMAKLLHLKLLMSAPGFALDMAGAIVDGILAETSKEADYAIVVNTELIVVGEKVMSYFFFIPDTKSLDKLIKMMGVNSK